MTDTPTIAAPAPTRPARDIRAIFAPSSVAIVGHSPKPPSAESQSWGWKVNQALRTVDYPGRVVSINPKHDEVDGNPCYPSLQDVPDSVECAVLAVGAAQTPAVLEDAGRAGVRGAVLLANGFAESSPEGAVLQEEVRRVADEYGMSIVGPNCMGLVNMVDRFAPYVSWIPTPPPYPTDELLDMALVFQSGAISISVTQHVERRGFRISHVVTCGNEVNTTLADYVHHIATTTPPRVICCYVESIRNPERFAEAAIAAREAGSSIIVLRVGRSELAKTTTQSHTGSVAGPGPVIDAFLRDLGVIQVANIDELMETAQLLRTGRTFGPGNIAMMTASGGATGLLADIAQEIDLQVDAFDEDLLRDLAAVLPGSASINNPIDLGASSLMARELYGATLEGQTYLPAVLDRLMSDDDIACLVLVLQETLATSENSLGVYRKLTSMAAAVGKRTGKPVAVSTISSGMYDTEVTRICAEAGIAPMQGMRQTLRAVKLVQQRDLAPADRTEGEAPAESGPPIVDEESFAVALRDAGAPVVGFEYVDSEADALEAAQRIGFPVVMKVAHPEVLHKSDVGGVFLEVSDAEAVSECWRRIIEICSPLGGQARALIQERVRGAAELLIGVTHEEGYPPAIVVGFGGIFVEILGDVSIAMAPVSKTRALEMLRSLKMAPLLEGVRGGSPLDVDAAADAVVAVSRLAVAQQGRFRSLEINPLLVRERGSGASIVDWLFEANAASRGEEGGN